MDEATYTSGQVARAAGVPNRRLEGWLERGIITVPLQRGRSRHGNRRRFTFGDALKVAVLAEAQRLHGEMTSRPGKLAAVIARDFRPDPHGLVASARGTLLVIRLERAR